MDFIGRSLMEVKGSTMQISFMPKLLSTEAFFSKLPHVYSNSVQDTLTLE